MKLAIALALALTCWMLPRAALADGAAFGCIGGGGGPYNACEGSCPVLLASSCEGKKVGDSCGDWEGTCREPSRLNCPELRDAGEDGAGPDGGATTLACLKERFCEPEEGGCSIGSDEVNRGRLVGLPALLFFGGIFLLAVDRHRRRRGRR